MTPPLTGLEAEYVQIDDDPTEVTPLVVWVVAALLIVLGVCLGVPLGFIIAGGF